MRSFTLRVVACALAVSLVTADGRGQFSFGRKSPSLAHGTGGLIGSVSTRGKHPSGISSIHGGQRFSGLHGAGISGLHKPAGSVGLGIGGSHGRHGPSSLHGAIKPGRGHGGGLGHGVGQLFGGLGGGKVHGGKVDFGSHGIGDVGKGPDLSGIKGNVLSHKAIGNVFGGGPVAGGGIVGTHTVIDGGFVNELDISGEIVQGAELEKLLAEQGDNIHVSAIDDDSGHGAGHGVIQNDVRGTNLLKGHGLGAPVLSHNTKSSSLLGSSGGRVHGLSSVHGHGSTSVHGHGSPSVHGHGSGIKTLGHGVGTQLDFNKFSHAGQGVSAGFKPSVQIGFDGAPHISGGQSHGLGGSKGSLGLSSGLFSLSGDTHGLGAAGLHGANLGHGSISLGKGSSLAHNTHLGLGQSLSKRPSFGLGSSLGSNFGHGSEFLGHGITGGKGLNIVRAKGVRLHGKGNVGKLGQRGGSLVHATGGFNKFSASDLGGFSGEFGTPSVGNFGSSFDTGRFEGFKSSFGGSKSPFGASKSPFGGPRATSFVSHSPSAPFGGLGTVH